MVTTWFESKFQGDIKVHSYWQASTDVGGDLVRERHDWPTQV